MILREKKGKYLMYNLGCILINSTVTHEYMHLQDAYEFCYNLDNRARVIEIYTEEQMDFLSMILGNYLKMLVLSWG